MPHSRSSSLLSHFLLLLALALASACGSTEGTIASSGSGGDGDGDGDDVPVEPEIVSLTIDPVDVSLEVVGDLVAAQQFTLVAEYSDGTTLDVTDEAYWSLSNGTLGAVRDGNFQASGTAGGVGALHGSFATLDAEATVSVSVEQARVADGALEDAAEVFEAAEEDPGVAPTIVYPTAGTYFPPNIGDFEVHWQPAAGTDLYEVSLHSQYASVSVYTASANWEVFSPQEWELLRESARGENIEIRVRALATANPTVAGTAELIDATLTSSDIRGGIYYWSASARGIFRHDMSRPGEPAEQYYTPAQSGGRCVACHAMSRDGTRMAVRYDGGHVGAGNIIDVETGQRIWARDVNWGLASFVPGTHDILTNDGGQLLVLDGSTGDIKSAVVAINGARIQPDFAPDGSAIAYRASSDVVTQSYDAATGLFGSVTNMTPGANPAWSPDSQWIIYDDFAAIANRQLKIISASGDTGPIDLLAGTGNASWPKWAPFAQEFEQPDGTREPIFWFTFETHRPFGVRGGATPQIWMAPFFPERAIAGEDPTGPAFRLPFQDLATGNLTAQWTEEIIEGPPPPE